MSLIGKNIKKIRSVKKLNQTAFATLFELKRTSIGAYEEGRAEPKIDTLIKIANYFSIPIDALLTKELTINDLYQFDIFKDEITTGHTKHNSVSGLLQNSSSDMPLVDRTNFLEYILKSDKSSYLNTLPTVSLPIKLNITSRAFEHTGEAMVSNNVGVKDGDIIIGLATPKQGWKKVQPNTLFIIVEQQRMLLRRVESVSEEAITFRPDNPNYSKEIIPYDNIKEIWKIMGFYSLHLPAHNQNRIDELENKLNQILVKLNQ